jgi:hypothetical protein
VCSTIDNAASWDIRAVIRFLHAKNMSSAEIQTEERMFQSIKTD